MALAGALPVWYATAALVVAVGVALTEADVGEGVGDGSGVDDGSVDVDELPGLVDEAGAVVDAVPDAVELALAEAEVPPEPGVGLLVGVAVEVGEPVGVGLGVSGSHFWLEAPVTAAARACATWACAAWACAVAGSSPARSAAGPPGPPAGAEVAAATMPKLDADTTRKPPAARLTAGRTCGKRMKALPCLFVVGTEEQVSSWDARTGRISPRLHAVHTIRHQTRGPALRTQLPRCG